MTDRYYEHHLEIRKDKLCPFKISAVERATGCVCNWHKNIEILVITRGHGGIRYGSRDMEICAGDVILVNSGVLHRLYSQSGIGYRYLIIDESFCDENGISTANRLFTPLTQSEHVNALFADAFYALTAYREEKGDAKALAAAKARGAVLALLIELCEHHAEAQESHAHAESRSEEHIKRAIAYMGDHYREPLSLEVLSSVCGITKCHLSREFKRYTGQTVLTYLNALRCKNAQMCLIEGMSVTETAVECGFESISYFSRTYKRVMGEMPSHALRPRARTREK